VDWGGGACIAFIYVLKWFILFLMVVFGLRVIELVGEVVDGALLFVGFNCGIVEIAFGYLECGVRCAGCCLEDLEIVWVVRIGTAVTFVEVWWLVRFIVVHWGILRWGG